MINFDTLLDVFFTMHDPTSWNRQGADEGPEYRSIILYSSDEQKEQAIAYMKKIQANFDKPIVTELKKLDAFYPAEGYHKDYYQNNKLQPYCALVIGPKIAKVKKKFGL